MMINVFVWTKKSPSPKREALGKAKNQLRSDWFDMVDLAFAASDTNHLALDLSFELVRVEIEGRTFVKTGEQKSGMLGYLEGNRTGLCLNPYEFVIFVYSDYKTNVLITRCFMGSIGPCRGMLSGMKCTGSIGSCGGMLSWLRMLRSGVREWSGPWSC